MVTGYLDTHGMARNIIGSGLLLNSREREEENIWGFTVEKLRFVNKMGNPKMV